MGMAAQQLFLASSFFPTHFHLPPPQSQEAERLSLAASFERLTCSLDQHLSPRRAGPAPKALKSATLHPAAGEPSTRRGLGSSREREEENEMASSCPWTGCWSELLITELQRSLLENQWTSITHGREGPSTGLGRKSARQRRLDARKQSRVSESEGIRCSCSHSISRRSGQRQSDCEEDRASLNNSDGQSAKSGPKMSSISRMEGDTGLLKISRSSLRKRGRKQSIVSDSGKGDVGSPSNARLVSRIRVKKQCMVSDSKEDGGSLRTLSYASEIEPGGKGKLLNGVRAGLKRCSSAQERRTATDSLSSHGSSLVSISESLASVTTLGLKCTKQLLTKEEELFLCKKMKVGKNLKATRIKLTQILGHEPPNYLWASALNLPFSQVQSKILDAHRARDQIFVSNLRLVFSLANKYSGYGLSYSDLVQEGALGLLLGLEKFDHTKGFRISTYVHWWIWQGITRALAGHSRTVRLPAHIHHRLGVINRASEALTTKGMPVSLKNLSHAVKLSEKTVTVTLKAVKKMVSFDKGKRQGSFGLEEESLHSFVADPLPDSDPMVLLHKKCLREDVDNLLSDMLNKREQEIVRLHYGLDGKPASLRKISQRFGITRERVRQIEDCAMQKLSAVARKIDFHPPLTY